MRPAEIGVRFGRAIRASAERAGMGRARPGAPAGRAGAAWVRQLPSRFDSARYAAAADRILAGTFDVLALRGAPLGFPPVWNVDPKTGTCAPLKFGKTLDYRSPRLVGDVKYLWELNRHLELVTLAEAWHLTREPRFAEGCRRLIDSWLTECPYPFGANWCSSLELAIRLVNWACTWQLLGAEESIVFAGEEGGAFRRRWLASIHQHCHFVSGHLSRHSSANNHLLGEVAGLAVAALNWPLWRSSPRWLARALAELNAQALRQNHEDGVNKEQAVWYHAAVADLMLLAGLVARANGRELGRAYWQRLESMIEFVAGIMDAGGNVPAFGDADDGVLVRWAPLDRGQLFGSLLATGAVLFERAEFAVKAGEFDDKSRWLLGDEAQSAFARLASAPRSGALPLPRFFPQGGYYLLGDAFDTAREVKIIADAGALGYLSIAAHGHADALSFTLSVAGQPLLIDP
ncbi:MAG: heparinase II/III family protein, partial [Steroidobacteraceae bacterium]